MPALTANEYKGFFTQALLAKGLGKKKFNDDLQVQAATPPALSDELQKIVDGLAEGMATAQDTWQKRQVVTVGPHTAAGPATGTPPAFGLP